MRYSGRTFSGSPLIGSCRPDPSWHLQFAPEFRLLKKTREFILFLYPAAYRDIIIVLAYLKIHTHPVSSVHRPNPIRDPTLCHDSCWACLTWLEPSRFSPIYKNNKISCFFARYNKYHVKRIYQLNQHFYHVLDRSIDRRRVCHMYLMLQVRQQHWIGISNWTVRTINTYTSTAFSFLICSMILGTFNIWTSTNVGSSVIRCIFHLNNISSSSLTNW